MINNRAGVRGVFGARRYHVAVDRHYKLDSIYKDPEESKNLKVITKGFKSIQAAEHAAEAILKDLRHEKVYVIEVLEELRTKSIEVEVEGKYL